MKKIILVVENELKNLKLVKDLLHFFKYDTIEAYNGKEAIEIVNKKFESIDLILMDIQMPIMDGLTATRILKKNKNTKDIPIIALTAFAMKEDEEKAIKAGCDGYITKPINILEFKKIISLYLERKETFGG
ncbi:response regulator [Tepidibacter formicigenes]|jgi:CheY-like chemotaxis protein|uniref:Stage 0 sporulation protein A homolog n=1 Tax=Tepidibacter formicigenes DSM 15518 TaxID=1123349 RepID=A0A1M6QSY0_9FIRM|nr:response regulator [Tepidibacter formicigenes]SHK23220.1 two-component system, cell cycle response regulator DivK [Tepidibacter formicigenes DSM 15518]